MAITSSRQKRNTTKIPSINPGEAEPRAVRARRTPTNPYLNPKESDVMKQLMFYLDHRFGVRGWTHVPNELLYLSWLQKWLPQNIMFRIINHMRAIGVKKDFPDILIFVSFMKREHFEDGDYLDYPKHGMAIEVKREKGGKVSPGQREWLEHFDSIGWATAIGYGYQDTVRKIEEVYGKQ